MRIFKAFLGNGYTIMYSHANTKLLTEFQFNQLPCTVVQVLIITLCTLFILLLYCKLGYFVAEGQSVLIES